MTQQKAEIFFGLITEGNLIEKVIETIASCIDRLLGRDNLQIYDLYQMCVDTGATPSPRSSRHVHCLGLRATGDSVATIFHPSTTPPSSRCARLFLQHRIIKTHVPYIVQGPGPLPFIGNLHQVPRKEAYKIYHQWSLIYGNCMSFYLSQALP